MLSVTVPAALAIDLRQVAPLDRQARVFSAFRELFPGEALLLTGAQSLESFYFQFQVEMPMAFAWDYLEAGPRQWRAHITRLAAPRSSARFSDLCCEP